MKFKKFFIVMLMLFVIGITCGCETGGTGGNGIKSIELDSETVVSEAIINEFDIRDWYLRIYRYDDTEGYDLVQVTYNMLSSDDIKKLVKIGTHELTITYEGFVIKHTLVITQPSGEDIDALMEEAMRETVISSTVTENFILPTTYSSISISWTSNNAAIVINNTRATVTRPAEGAEDATCTLTATFKYYEEVRTKEYTVIVPSKGMEEIYQLLEQVENSIIVPSKITDELQLLFASNGVSVNWTSSNTNVILIDNAKQSVTVNPVINNTTVNLSFTLTYKGQVYDNYQGYSVTVIPVQQEVQAPTPSNVSLNEKVVSWTGVSGVSKYNIYNDNKLITTVSTTSVDLGKYLTKTDKYNIGVQAVATGSYNVDSDIVYISVDYTYDNPNYQYNGTYYNGINLNQSGNSLKSDLRSLLISTHKSIRTYENLKKDIAKSDVALDDSSKVIAFYSRVKLKAAWDSTNKIWNREHVWPQSTGGFGTKNAGADLHHLRPTDYSVNSARGNHPFGEVTNGSIVKMSPQNGGGSSNCYLGGGYFEPQDAAKGDVARILFYLVTRYADLDAKSITLVAQSYKMLLEWNELDPVDEWEMNRNDISQSIQGNRNPFIDHPELAREIWG